MRYATNPETLTTLAERNRYLMDVSVRAGDELYSPDIRLVRQCHDTAPYFNGYTIGQVSLEYALALLETGGDAERADDVVARTLDFQDLNKGSATYGNFIWMANWTEVRDRNAVAFMSPNYCLLWQRHRDRLSPQTRARMEAMFPTASEGVNRHVVPWQYTNIFLLRILSWLMLGKVMNDDKVVQRAADQWELWLHGTSSGGWTEFNSPCYTPVQLYTLAGLWEECADDSWRQSIQKALEALYTEFAANLHPASVCLSGPMSRGYPMDYLSGSGLSAIVAYQQFGLYHAGKWDTNGGTTPFIVNFAIHDYEAPKSIRQIPHGDRAPYTVRSTIPETKVVTTNFLDNRFTLGSLCSAKLHSQAIPVVVCRETVVERRTALLRLEPSAGAESLSIQRDNRVLGWVRLAEPSQNSSGGVTWRGARWLLGPWRHINRLHVNGSPWSGGGTEYRQAVNLTLEIEGVLLGLHVLALAEEQPLSIEVIEKELELRIEMPVDESPANHGFVFYLEVRDTSQHDSNAFFEDFASLNLSFAENPDPLTMIRGKEGEIMRLRMDKASEVLEEPDSPIYQFLHESPFLQLKRGELTTLPE